MVTIDCSLGEGELHRVAVVLSFLLRRLPADWCSVRSRCLGPSCRAHARGRGANESVLAQNSLRLHAADFCLAPSISIMFSVANVESMEVCSVPPLVLTRPRNNNRRHQHQHHQHPCTVTLASRTSCVPPFHPSLAGASSHQVHLLRAHQGRHCRSDREQNFRESSSERRVRRR